MPSRKFLFADEAGDFDFTRKPNGRRYFILCTVTLETCELGHQLLDLRRDLAWHGNSALKDYFHACDDQQCVRDAVFAVIGRAPMRVDATILEKSKAGPRIRSSHARFYEYAWQRHFEAIAPSVLSNEEEMLLTAASLGRSRERAAFTSAINNVVQSVPTPNSWATYFCPAATDPCLQIADYCTWAIQRKWERNDSRSYDLISHTIVRECDLWSASNQHYY